MGKSGGGKTTLIEALRGEKIEYKKTQYIDYSDDFVDTPGEYTEGNDLGGALAVCLGEILLGVQGVLFTDDLVQTGVAHDDGIHDGVGIVFEVILL